MSSGAPTRESEERQGAAGVGTGLAQQGADLGRAGAVGKTGAGVERKRRNWAINPMPSGSKSALSGGAEAPAEHLHDFLHQSALAECSCIVPITI